MARRNLSSFLPWLLGPIDWYLNGTKQNVERREAVDFVLAGATVEDDPENERTIVTMPIGSGSVANLGAGRQIWKESVSGEHRLRSLTAGANITLTQNANDIEIASSGVTPPWAIYVGDYGAVGDGVTDDTAAIQAAFDAASSPSGADDYQGSYEVRFANEGRYLIAGQLDLDYITNLRVKGPAQLHFTTSDSTRAMFRILSCAGIAFEDITFSYDSTTFNHNMIETGHGASLADVNGLHFIRCRFLTYSYAYGNHNAYAFIRLANAINVHIKGCSFTGAERAISGYSTAGGTGPDATGFANNVTIEDSIFAKLTEASVHNPGEVWNYKGNNFEPLLGPGYTSVSSRAIYQEDLTYYSWAQNITGNWIGDGGGDPTHPWIQLRSLGIHIAGNLISGNDPDSVIKIGGSNGVTIIGNRISGRVEFTLPGGNYTTGVLIAGNTIQSAVPYVGEGNIAGMYTRISNEDTAAGQILSRPITIGDYGCTYTRPILTGLKAWPSGGGDPGTIAAGTYLTSGDITVAGALVGQVVAVGCDVAPPDGVTITANVTASSVCRVTITNLSGSDWSPGATNFRFHLWS